MPEANEPDVNAILGATHALMMFAKVLAFTSSIPETLLSNLNEADQHSLATIEVQSLNEKVIESYQSAVNGLREILNSRASGTSRAT